MILVILMGAGGLYLLVMSTGLIHRKFMSTVDRFRRIGMILLGSGFFILSIVYYRYFEKRFSENFRPPEIYHRLQGQGNEPGNDPGLEH